MAQFDTFFSAYGLAAVFTLVLVKAVGVPIPIPSDVILLATAMAIAEGRLSFGSAFVALLSASLIGSVGQFLFLRGPGRRFVYRYGRRLGMTAERLDRLSGLVNNGGWMGIGLALITPGLRSVTVAACGLSAVPFRRFVVGLMVGTAPSLALNLGLYYAGGTFIQSLRFPLPVFVALLMIVSIVAVPISWAIFKRPRLVSGIRNIERLS